MKKLLRGVPFVVDTPLRFGTREHRNLTMRACQSDFKVVRLVRRTAPPTTPPIVNIANAQGTLRQLTLQELEAVASRSGSELVASLRQGGDVEI